MHYNLFKSSNRKYLEEIKHRGHEMPILYDAVNILQKTEWLVNEPVYKVFKHCLDNNIPLGKLPVNPESIELPPKPADIATNKDALIKWKKLAKPIHYQKVKLQSKFIQVHQIKAIVERYRKLNKGFFFPQQYDFRGRLYPKPAMFEPQSADYARALMKFKFGKKMGTNENFEKFAIYGANLFGEVDKEPIEVRLKWVTENSDRIIATATDPLNDHYWDKADKAFAFLAWAIEYKAFAKSEFDADFITTLPIQADCSNSGLQHYSAMMRDEIGGKATNLIPSNKPQDVYNEVAENVIEKLERYKREPRLPEKKKDKVIEYNDVLFATQWLDYGINRKTVKKPVMCLPYSLTRFSCRKYLEEHVLKEEQDRGVYNPFKEDLFKATQYLMPIVWQSIGEVIVGAKNVMKFLQEVSRLVSSENLPVCWLTPNNYPVQMWNYETESKRVKTRMGDSVIKLTLLTNTDRISKRDTSQAVAPNFIHSLDSACLQLAVVKARTAGIENFCMIHDSFGVLAPDYDVMAVAVREAFCEIYEKDVLANWAKEMHDMLSEKNQRKFPKLPPKGRLDLALVKKSIFFCI